jgi:hypothetical protein
MPGLFFRAANGTIAPAMTHESYSESSARGDMNGEISQRPSEQLVSSIDSHMRRRARKITAVG